MTLAAWLAAFAVVMALLALFGDLLAALPMAARAAVISGMLVTVMVNLVMPRLTAAINRLTDAPHPGTASAGRPAGHADQGSVQP